VGGRTGLKSSVAAGLGGALSVLAVTGCGELGGSFRGTRPVRPAVVSPAQLARQPEGSPGRALLTWCKAAQERDGTLMRRMYVSWAGAAAAREDALTSIRMVARTGCPTALETDVEGDQATVFGQVVVARTAPNGRVDSASTPIAFNLERSGGSWTVLPGAFLSLRPASPERGQTGSRRRLVTRADLRRWKAGSPQRAALELVRLAQYADAVAVTRFLAPNWRLNTPGVAFHLRNVAELARDWHVPEITSSSASGATAAIEALLSGTKVHVELRRRAGRWQVTRFRSNTLDLP
jgi:hypothetical protein